MALFAVHISSVENSLVPGESSLHTELFQHPFSRWGTPDMDLLVSRFNNKPDRCVARTRDPQAFATNALVTP